MYTYLYYILLLVTVVHTSFPGNFLTCALVRCYATEEAIATRLLIYEFSWPAEDICSAIVTTYYYLWFSRPLTVLLRLKYRLAHHSVFHHMCIHLIIYTIKLYYYTCLTSVCVRTCVSIDILTPVLS